MIHATNTVHTSDESKVINTLTLEKARQVANEIRRTRVGGGVDRAYWPWVIETLAAEVEAVCKQKEALRKELEWMRTRTVRGELDAVRAEKTGEAQ